MKDIQIIKTKSVKDLHAELGKLVAAGHGSAKWVPNFSGPNGGSDGIEVYTGKPGNFTDIAKLVNECES